MRVTLLGFRVTLSPRKGKKCNPLRGGGLHFGYAFGGGLHFFRESVTAQNACGSRDSADGLH